jgi:UDP-3-O-[3-hydroxymyristoyl] glucosamine N-acyltransferase
MKTREIAEFLRAELVGDADVEIERVAALDNASTGAIAFVESPEGEITSGASCLLVPLDFSREIYQPIIKTRKPKLAFSRVATALHPAAKVRPMVHSSALVRDSARVGDDVFIGPFVCIDEDSAIGSGTELRAGTIVGKNVSIGKNCVFHFGVVVEDGCTIGDNVVLHSGVVIGADGFGYVPDEKGEHHKFPQIGTVVVEDNVEIGANTCIDRGALGETRIGEGTKIDNLVQIAHNVQIGKRVIIAAQTGISGSTVIEDDCVIGGQVGMGDHATVKSGAVIGSQAGVLPGKIVRPGVWWGTPVQPLDDYKVQNANLKALGRLKERVKELEAEISRLKTRSRPTH